MRSTRSRFAFATLAASIVIATIVPACESKSDPKPAPTPNPTTPAPTTTTAPSTSAAPATTPAPAAAPKPTAPPAASVIPADLVSSGTLPDAPKLGDVMKESKVGDRVTFAARVAGRADPFVAGRAMMTVSDPRLLPCNEREDDACPTPADLCCESRETLLANVATVQVVDAAGKPIPVALNGVEGLAALDHVVVEGVLVERGENGGFVVNAVRVVRRGA